MTDEIDNNNESDASASRRAILKGIGGIGATAAVAALGTETAAAMAESADAHVSTADELVVAAEARDVRTVWIESDATIDLSGYERIPLENMALLSGRADGVPGAKLYTDEYPDRLFQTAGRVHIAGMRFQGANESHFAWPGYSSGMISAAIGVEGDVTVENCELHGWTHAGVAVGAPDVSARAYIRDCDFHHCQMGGLGYGVNLYEGDARIERCTFDYTRHAIAAGGAGGADNARYTAIDNFHGPNTVLHGFDMHGNDDWTAGDWIVIRNNTFTFDHQNAVKIRGVPKNACWIDYNQFLHSDGPEAPGTPDSAVRQIHYGSAEPFANIELSGNVYRPRDWTVPAGAPLDVIMRYFDRLNE